MHVQKLLQQANEYTEAYARKYSIADEELLQAIFNSHLAYLINSLFAERDHRS